MISEAPESTASTRDASSIDKLLALTDEGWELEEQVKTLKQAALTRPLAEHTAARAPVAKSPSLHLPTPYELAPTRIGATAAAASSAQASTPSTEASPAPPSTAGTSGTPGTARPPPLPARASKKPPPLPRASAPPMHMRTTPEPPSIRSTTPVTSDLIEPAALVDLLGARLATLEGASDKVGLARTHIELAIASETILADDARAAMHAESALRIDPSLPAAHALLRRRKHARAALPAILDHLEQELAAATAAPATVELLAEKARLLEAMGDRGDQVRSTWEQALAHAPAHAAALKGLEAELSSRGSASDAASAESANGALSVHLARMADAYASEPELAAWLHVERARLLEKKLGRVDAARAALDRAVELDPSVGPVRDARVRHAATHGDWAGLAKLLADEAEIETLDARCAALELDAACIARARLGEEPRAVELLERAAARAPTEPSVDRRVLDELVRLHESAARLPEAARARRARLRFVTDPPLLAYELRALALTSEKLGDVGAAIQDVQRALAVDASDPTLVETLDRLLAAAGRDDQRVALWVTEAARTDEGTKRARALGRAAQIAENALGRPIDAVRHLRAAWVAAPGDTEVLDALSRLLTPAPSEVVDREVRGLVDLYAQAAEHTRDRGRRIAYLEKVALLWEELLGEPSRAARVFEEILSLDPDRRSAILGLERTAARLGDARALSRALLDEARLSDDGGNQLSLRTRAAAALAKTDQSRALSLVHEVLDHDPAHTGARALETRLHEESGRWELAAQSIRARIDLGAGALANGERVGLWIALAQIQDMRLHTPLDALASLQAARALDPSHPVPPEEIARVLDATGDVRALRAATEQLATHAATADERARHLVRAAELDELRLDDDASAARLYAQALAETPDDELVADRLARVLARRGAAGELATLTAKRIERATSPAVAQALAFDLAWLLADTGQDAARATGLLDALLAEQPTHVPALRTLEALRRRSGEWAPLARVLARQGDALRDVRARLGALWNLASLEEWRLPVSDATATYKRILDLDPTDPGALEATVRRDLASARRGDARARRAVIAALRALVPFAPDEGTRLAVQLRLSLLLEAAAGDAADSTGGVSATEALERYRDALRIDELSVTAAAGLARLSNRLGDAEGAIAAATSLAELAVDPRVRARYLVDAAETLLGPDDDERLGPRSSRRVRAALLLEKALESEPDSIAAAGRLATILLEEHEGERLVVLFRAAIQRAKSPDAVVMLGSEIARVARDELKDLTVAIDAMRRVRALAPQHVPSLLTLAELCIAQRAWPEAVDALEAVVSTSREVAPRLTALFALASVYEKVLSKPEEVERVLRAALTIDPSNPRAMRALLRRLGHLQNAESASTGTPRHDIREEMEELLTRLAEVENAPDAKSEILLELADVRLQLGDSDHAKRAEQALIDAVAHAPNNARAFARLATFYKTPQGRDHVAYARALAAVIGFGQQLGKADPRWFATLGQLEVESLGRLRDGVVHLQRAVQMDPALFETRYELANAFARMSANEEAARVLVGMISPSPRPLLAIADPAAALELLERTLGAERRGEEAIVVSELRAIGGELDDGRHGWLRARRLGPVDPHHQMLDRPTLVTHVLPPEGRHVLLEVAAAIAGIESKMLRSDLGELGIGSRDRVSSRSGHPTRALLDRLVKQLGLGEIELVISPNVTRTRVLAQDVPWIVVPRGLVDLPEPTQLAALGRALARIAFGVPWLEELPPPHIEALLVAAARQVVPTYGADDLDVLSGKLVTQHEQGVARVLSRRQKKLLEELAPHIAAPQGRLMPIEALIGALARGELRAAYVLTGDLLATVDELRAIDTNLSRLTESPGPAALAAILEHAYAGDIARFALTTEATALRRRVGATWTG